MDEVEFLRRLRGHIGRECTYLGRSCRLLEILAEEGILVIETREKIPPIQQDQYGQPAYRANEVVQIPIFGSSADELSQDLMDILACLQTCASEGSVG